MSKLTPECPYCSRYITRPEKTMTEFGEIISGKCECGAVYVCDPTGHNVGEAYGDALALAKGAWNIDELETESYDEKELDYDMKSHSRISVKGMGFHASKLIFVKLYRPEEAVIEEKADSEADLEASAALEDPALSGKKLKDKVKYLLEKGLLAAVGKLALQDKNVIKWLISFSYDKQDALTWRAIEAMGFVARGLRITRLDIIRETIRRLLWSMGDESGGIGWSAPEILGEIIRSDPNEFSDIVPILWGYREENSFRAGVVRAITRVAEVRPDMVECNLEDLRELAADPDPEVRGLAVLLAAEIPLKGKEAILKRLSDDSGSLLLYFNGILQKTSVSELVKRPINKNGK